MSLKEAIASRRLSGVAVPLWSIRAEGDFGTGEFSHLPLFAEWCRSVDLEVVQLLPVHDSGHNSSPYSAISAFALNPLYLDLTAIPSAEGEPGRLQALRHKLGSHETLAYEEVRSEKLSVAREIFDGITELEALDAWIDAHPWIRSYAAYVVLKEQKELTPWWEWGQDAEPSTRLIDRLWTDEESGTTCRFLTWIQRQLEAQFDSAVAAVHDRGIYLKGDVPILMSRDSADVWWERRVFDLNYQAGAPPDMFSADGQNWGFPVYNWQMLKSEDYGWWRSRLTQAERWFDAVRIDHVLGFFRIWAIPESDLSGQLGHYRPGRLLTAEDVRRVGIDEERLEWLAEPHVTGSELRALFGDRFAPLADALFSRIADQELYRFRPDIQGEANIVAVTDDAAIRETLLGWYRDRALVRVGEGEFAPAWFADRCSRLSALSDEERSALFELFDVVSRESSPMWREAGYERLATLAANRGFLPCAEDLGAVPPVVPDVLRRLSILGLKIPRWTRMWDSPGQPFVAPGEYPPLTVCTPAVHDTSSIRGWWEEEADRGAFWGTFGLEHAPPDTLSAADVEAILSAISQSVTSVLFVAQLQDYLAVDPEVAPRDPDAERINWPGTVSERNWVYRMPVTIQALNENRSLVDAVRRIANRNQSRNTK